jgi:acyl-CoA hydrolase
MWAEDRASGRRYKVASAYLTFVALDENTGRPRPVPGVVAGYGRGEAPLLRTPSSAASRRIEGC